MEGSKPLRIVDVSEVRFRVGTVKTGVWITLAVCSVGIAYAIATWERSNRGAIVALLAVACAGAAGIRVLDAEKIVRGRWRELFFLLWSVLDIALVATLQALDGGARSPMVFIYMLPIAFAALSYPMFAVVAISLLDVSAFTVVSASVDPPGVVYIAFVAASLGCAAALCVSQAQNAHRQRSELARVSRTDALTEALNRRGFEERLDAELGESARGGDALALLVLDLDNFKFVNDTQGHAAGDELLRWVARTVRVALRPIDSLGRLGGDEFAVVLPGAARPDALEVGERIQQALAKRVEATIGVAAFPVDGTDREELHRHADTDLYGAKHERAQQVPRDLAWAAALAEGVDRRMTPPVEHSGAVAGYATGIATELGIEGEELSLVGMAGMLHDVGKVALPDRVLVKPGPLTAEEAEQIVRAHPVVGADLVARVDGLAAAVPWIRHSHEHFDGSGYPDGLAGEEIPLVSRILLVADAFHAMTSRRAYRRAVPAEQALAELRRCAGAQFDPRVVDALEAHLTRAEAPA